MSLTKEQLKRYCRHLLLPEIGLQGQEKLLNARVLVVGAGGLGCLAALYLAAVFDALSMNWRKMQISRNPNCPVCGNHPEITELQDYEVFCGEARLPEGVESKPLDEVLKLCEAGRDDLLLLGPPAFRNRDGAGPGWCRVGTARPVTDRVGEFEAYTEETVVAYCSAGTRSMRALEILKNAGFKKLINLADGLDRI